MRKKEARGGLEQRGGSAIGLNDTAINLKGVLIMYGQRDGERRRRWRAPVDQTDGGGF